MEKPKDGRPLDCGAADPGIPGARSVLATRNKPTNCERLCDHPTFFKSRVRRKEGTRDDHFDPRQHAWEGVRSLRGCDYIHNREQTEPTLM